MSLGISATAWAVTAAVAATTYQGYQANKANQQQRSAQKQATAQANKAADQADQANNKANAKTPDIAAMLLGNTQKQSGGGASLTGPGGIDTSQLLLGKNTLLGG
jgi:hypothetical protein